MNYNKIILGGNLTRDPQLSYLPSNTAVTEFGLAVNRKFKKQGGEQGEETLFVDVQAFAKTGELINEHFRKGDQILIEGRLKLDQWTDKDGGKRSKHRVVMESFSFIGGKKNGEAKREPARAYTGAADMDDSDVPF